MRGNIKLEIALILLSLVWFASGFMACKLIKPIVETQVVQFIMKPK